MEPRKNAILMRCVVLLVLVGSSIAASAQVAQTPPMGWNSWNHFGKTIDDATVRAQAAAMVSTGMQAAGYTYVNIDDSWQGTRDGDGNIQSNSRFPDMAALATYVHGLGLKIGIYSSPGQTSCAGYVGSYGHEAQDAQTFANWGFDYLKYDWCSAGKVYQPVNVANMEKAYNLMDNGLKATMRPIVYSIDQYGMLAVWKWGASTGADLWRTSQDVKDDFYEMAEIGFGQGGLQSYAGPGHWNDPDMLQIGNGGMTNDEYQIQMTLWCILAAPLIAGNDLTAMTPPVLALLANPEVTAVDQDSLGIQGKRVWEQGPLEVWVKPLSTTGPNAECSNTPCLAVGVFNRGMGQESIPLNFPSLGISGQIAARDLWAHKDLGQIKNGHLVVVPTHGAALLKLGK